MNHDQIREGIREIVDAYSPRDRTRPLTKAQYNKALELMYDFEFFQYSVSKFGNLLLIGHEECVVIGREGRVSAQWGTTAQLSFVGNVDAKRFVDWSHG